MKMVKYSKAACLLGIKLSLTFLAFYVISKKITFNPMSYLNESNMNYFLLAMLVVFILILLQAWRWKNILKGIFDATEDHFSV